MGQSDNDGTSWNLSRSGNEPDGVPNSLSRYSLESEPTPTLSMTYCSIVASHKRIATEDPKSERNACPYACFSLGAGSHCTRVGSKQSSSMRRDQDCALEHGLPDRGRKARPKLQSIRKLVPRRSSD